ncbi:MAG: type II secretion system protein GspD [Phycisphaerales bacterium]
MTRTATDPMNNRTENSLRTPMGVTNRFAAHGVLSRRVWVGAGCVLLAASAGAAWPMGAWMLASSGGSPAVRSPVVQDQPKQDEPAAQPPAAQPPASQPDFEAQRKAAEEQRAKMDEMMRQRRELADAERKRAMQGGAGGAGQPGQPVPLQPGVNRAQPVMPGGQDGQDGDQPDQGEQPFEGVPAPEGAGGANGPEIAPANAAAPHQGALVGVDDLISLDFTDPIDLMAFVDFVSKSLNINIIGDEGLAGRRVVFRAPVKIKASELLQLLSRLIEDQDFILSQDPLGFYTIKSSAKVPIVMDGVGVELPTTRIIPTPMVRPSIMQQAIQAAMGGQGGVGGGPRITAVDDIGVLIVTGPGGSLATVESLANTIQAELAKQKLHRLALVNVSADFALNRILILNGKMAQQAGGGGIPGGGQVPNQGGGGVGGSLTHLDSRLFIDPGNALIFRGTDEEALKVRELVSVIDTVNTLIARRYDTGSVTADVALAGERIGLGPVTQISSGGIGGSGFAGGSGGGGFGGNQFGGGGGQGASQSDLPGSGFSVDIERGSLIYYGTDRQHAEVAKLAKEFAEMALNEDVEIRAYKLFYAKAESGDGEDGSKGVAEILNELLENPADQTARSDFLPRSGSSTRRGTSSPLVTPPAAEPSGAASGGSGSEDGASLTATKNDVIIVADGSRNQVIIKAPNRLHREFSRIIKKLDVRQRQVYVEAKIVAMRLDDTFTFRSDLQIDAEAFQFLSSFGITAPAANTVFNATRIIPQPAQGVSGVTAALLNQDSVQGVIQALQVVGDARIVSTPRILVNDNKEATQESTREEPFAATSQTAGSPTVTSQGGTASAGTKLKVKPAISENGDIVLDYEIELSNFDRSASSNSNLQPPKQQEVYKSSVTVPSDSTIVVGGFTFEAKQNTENKVPILGDIPLVGLLFKSISEVTNRTTIFVFITPKVLSDPTGADLRILTEGPMKEARIEGITPKMSPETISISPRTMTLPGLDQSIRTPGAIDSKHRPRRDFPLAEPVPVPTTEPAPSLAPETMPEGEPVPPEGGTEH